MSILESGRRVPRDPALPGLTRLLEAGRLMPLLGELFPDETVSGCRPLYVRYKPGTNLVVAWNVDLDGRSEPAIIHAKAHNRDHFEVARNKAESGRWIEPEAGLPYLAVPEDAVLLFTFPNDATLPGLRLVSDRKKMQRALYAHVTSHPEDQWRLSDRKMIITPIRFKPEKRAVLQIDTRAVHRTAGQRECFRIFARVSSNPRAGQVAELMNRLHGDLADHPYLSTPGALAHLADTNTTLVVDAGGKTVGFDAEGAKAAGKALAALHRLPTAGVPGQGFRGVVESAADNAPALSDLLPELTEEIEDLAGMLVARSAGHETRVAGLVHGDFHPEQLLAREDGLVVLDFDRAHAGDIRADLGNYRAHLILGDLTGDGNSADDLADLFVAEYASAGGAGLEARALAFWTAVGLLNLAPTPFRRLDPSWPEQTVRLLAACRKELECA